MDLSKAKGMIFGLAIGDALGYPVEFMTLRILPASFLFCQQTGAGALNL
jgi:ADP-ribosylglycohydrolase